MYTIKHLFHIAQARESVYAALSTGDGLANWWVHDVSGSFQPQGVIQFRFHPSNRLDLQVVELDPGRTVLWECVAGPAEWIGTRVQFSLDENEGKTRVRFSHTGFQAQDDTYAAMSFSWARYLESLRQLCQTGKGQPFMGAPPVQAG